MHSNRAITRQLPPYYYNVKYALIEQSIGYTTKYVNSISIIHSNRTVTRQLTQDTILISDLYNLKYTLIVQSLE